MEKKCSEAKQTEKNVLNWKYTDVCLKTLVYKSKYAFIQYDYEKARHKKYVKGSKKTNPISR